MTLHPSLTPRIIYWVGSVVLLGFSIVGLYFNPIAGGLGVLFFGFAAVNANFRLFHPRSYATELDDHGFRVYDSLGRLVHDVAWADVAHLTVFHGNGLRGPGTSLFLAWRCEPGNTNPAHPGRQPWARGGTNRMGEAIDGALPSSYLGIDRMLALFKERADRAHVDRSREARPVIDVRLESF